MPTRPNVVVARRYKGTRIGCNLASKPPKEFIFWPYLKNGMEENSRERVKDAVGAVDVIEEDFLSRSRT